MKTQVALLIGHTGGDGCGCVEGTLGKARAQSLAHHQTTVCVVF